MNLFARFWNRTFPPSRLELKETDRKTAQLITDQTRAFSRLFETLEDRLAALEIRAEEAKSIAAVAAAPILMHEHPTYLPDDEPHPIFNCSVVLFEGKLVYVARCTNFTAHRDGHWTYQKLPHKTYCVMYTSHAEVWERQIVDDSLISGRSLGENYAGFEDIRLFVWRGALMGICALIFNSESGQPNRVTQAIVQFGGSVITNVWPLASPLDRAWEKNWIPVVKTDRLFIVYSFDPIVVFEFDAGVLTLVKGRVDHSLNFHIRGGTQLVPYEKGFLGLVHSTQIYIGARIHYLHSFVKLTSDLDLEQVSSQFFLQRKGIEFASGLVDTGENLVLSYGLTERRAAYCRISYEQLAQWIA